MEWDCVWWGVEVRVCGRRGEDVVGEGGEGVVG